MAVEIDSIPGFRLSAYFLSSLCSVVSCIYVPLPNKKSGNLNSVLLGAVGAYMNVFLSSITLRTLISFQVIIFYFIKNFSLMRPYWILQKLQNHARMEQVFSDLLGHF